MAKVTGNKTASGTLKSHRAGSALSQRSAGTSAGSVLSQGTRKNDSFKSSAGSALSQGSRKGDSFKSGTTSKYRSAAKSKYAPSALTQVRNPRSGRYVKIDKSTGTIIAHKKSPGAYTGVKIVRTKR